jgi:hypothetical protein
VDLAAGNHDVDAEASVPGPGHWRQSGHPASSCRVKPKIGKPLRSFLFFFLSSYQSAQRLCTSFQEKIDEA